jgi:hypothetical protein
MFCCKIYHTVKRNLFSLYYTKEPQLNQYIEEDGTLVISVSLDREIRKYKLLDNPRYLTPKEVESMLANDVELPWLWIGASMWLDPVDMTNCLEEYVVAGNTITLAFLYEKFPWYSGWTYLDPETFEEVEFPAKGITINASRMERVEEKSKEAKDSE